VVDVLAGFREILLGLETLNVHKAILKQSRYMHAIGRYLPCKTVVVMQSPDIANFESKKFSKRSASPHHGLVKEVAKCYG